MTDLLPGPQLRRSWKHSDRFVPRAVVRPVLGLMQAEAAGGAIMLIAAALALVWANSGWSAGYAALWATPVTVHIGSVVDLDMTLQSVVNEGAMSLFFLVAGLEIKRQLVEGELRDRRAAALPVLAALGGMIVPALIYVAFNAGHPGAGGWGIPVATDIAFAVGVVTLAGNRVPLGAKVFILTLAVADDVGGIVVIAVFYAQDVRFTWLLLAAATVAAAVGLRRLEVRSIAPYAVVGTICWYALHHAGVESAIAGVIFGLLTPIEPFHDPAGFGPTARWLVDRVEHDGDETAAEDLARYALETTSPLERVEGRLSLWVAMGIVPLFALANAGVKLSLDGLDSRVVLGVAVGLVVGKTVGVFGASWLVVRSGLGRLPGSTTWRQLFGLGVTAGIGFTVALFVTGLSFDDAALTASAKVGILLASSVAGALGYLSLRSSPSGAASPLEPA